MKFLFFIIIISFFSIFLSSCYPDRPEIVAKKFINHLDKKEYSDAKYYSTDETKKFIDLIAAAERIPDIDTSSEYFHSKKILSDMNCIVSENIAVCTYYENEAEACIDLVKIDNKWLVSLTKEHKRLNFDPSLFDKAVNKAVKDAKRMVKRSMKSIIPADEMISIENKDSIESQDTTNFVL